MLKTITSALPAFSEASYTVVDVKFETGSNSTMDAVANHFEDSNNFQHQFEEEDDDVLQTPNSSPPQESNKRKRSVPKKFSVDEDENPLHVNNTTDLVVKTEDVDYSQHTYEDIAVPESRTQGHFQNAASEDWDEAALDQIDRNRISAAQINSKQRDDCPICGDKANGLHYGVYTCEGCKNFFKRSVVMTQKKPYICNNANSCDVRIVIDMSGIKRKGARCQACRYTACLDAGMFHSGYPRSRGGRHPPAVRTGAGVVTTPLLKEFLNTGERTDKRLRRSFEEGLDTSSWDGMVYGTPIDVKEDLKRARGQSSESSSVKDPPPLLQLSYEDASMQESEEMVAKAGDIFDSVIRDELEKEKSKNKELSVRLVEKEKQLKIAERQTENMKRHMVISQGVSAQQQEEIKKLRNEINRLSVFRSTVRNYQEQNNSNDYDNSEVIPANMCSVSYNE